MPPYNREGTATPELYKTRKELFVASSAGHPRSSSNLQPRRRASSLSEPHQGALKARVALEGLEGLWFPPVDTARRRSFQNENFFVREHSADPRDDVKSSVLQFILTQDVCLQGSGEVIRGQADEVAGRGIGFRNVISHRFNPPRVTLAVAHNNEAGERPINPAGAFIAECRSDGPGRRRRTAQVRSQGPCKTQRDLHIGVRLDIQAWKHGFTLLFTRSTLAAVNTETGKNRCFHFVVTCALKKGREVHFRHPKPESPAVARPR